MKKFWSILFISCLLLFVISFSISIPILSRSFYYSQIDSLKIEEDSGLSKKEIKNAYNDMMDFLVKGKKFSVGDLSYSVEGKAHFEDCRVLFVLDFVVLGISSFLCIVLIVLWAFKKIRFKNFFGFGPTFYVGILLLLMMSIIGISCAINFDVTFELFHNIMFPGKTNWQFDGSADEIISILPERFFLNCAIAIVSIVTLLSIVFLCIGISTKKRNKKKNN